MLTHPELHYRPSDPLSAAQLEESNVPSEARGRSIVEPGVGVMSMVELKGSTSEVEQGSAVTSEAESEGRVTTGAKQRCNV